VTSRKVDVERIAFTAQKNANIIVVLE